MSKRWIDEAIPTLGGLTPREAATRKGARRDALFLLLAEIEHAEARYVMPVLDRVLGFSSPVPAPRGNTPRAAMTIERSGRAAAVTT